MSGPGQSRLESADPAEQAGHVELPCVRYRVHWRFRIHSVLESYSSRDSPSRRKTAGDDCPSSSGHSRAGSWSARPFPHVLLENVPNWRVLHKGEYLREVAQALEKLGYRWAYRTVDALAFGAPQRR